MNTFVCWGMANKQKVLKIDSIRLVVSQINFLSNCFEIWYSSLRHRKYCVIHIVGHCIFGSVSRPISSISLTLRIQYVWWSIIALNFKISTNFPFIYLLTHPNCRNVFHFSLVCVFIFNKTELFWGQIHNMSSACFLFFWLLQLVKISIWFRINVTVCHPNHIFDT